MTRRMFASTFAVALTMAVSAPAMAAGNPATGATLVKQRCQICHVVAKGAKPTALAPNLNGVVGRKAAATTDFALYSPALKASGITWTPAQIDAFLAAPGKLVPGTKMVIAVPDATQRADIVAFLTTNK